MTERKVRDLRYQYWAGIPTRRENGEIFDDYIGSFNANTAKQARDLAYIVASTWTHRPPVKPSEKKNIVVSRSFDYEDMRRRA